jgi:uncharacterized protein YjdB
MRAVKVLSFAVVFAVVGCGPKVASIDLSPDRLSLTKKGEVQALSATPKDAEKKKVEGATVVFTSASPAVATVDAAGKVTAVKSGDTTIVATLGQVTASAPVKVAIPASISLAPADVKLVGAGSKAMVVAKVLDDAGRPATAEVTWESADAKIATVKGGEIVAVGAGETKVFAVAAEVKAPVKVTVAIPVVATVEADKELDLKVGTPGKLKVVAKDAEGKEIANTAFTYAIDNAKVATVDAAGTVTPVGKGKAKLTVTAGEKSATVEVKVKK